MLEKYTKKDSVYKYRGLTCLNCHLPLDKNDKFCPNCGQANSTKKLSFSDFFAEFFSGVFSYDSRFQRTLRVLLFRPGKISKDYINGKRMRYANPFRFYLSASILFFLLFSFNFDSEEAFGKQDADQEIFTPDRYLSEKEKAEIDSINKIVSNTGIKLSDIKKDTTRTSYKDKYYSQSQIDSMNAFNSLIKKADLYYHFQEETGVFNATRAMDSLKHEQTGYNHWIYKKSVDAGTFADNPGLFINYFISKLPFIIFIYLPVFALFVWLLYVRRSFNYMEHLVFAFHVQTTFFVLYGLAFLIEMIIESGIVFTIVNFTFLFYLYKAMRNFYGQGRVKTILKFILLNIIFFTLAVIATIFSLLASFTIY